MRSRVARQGSVRVDATDNLGGPHRVDAVRLHEYLMQPSTIAERAKQLFHTVREAKHAQDAKPGYGGRRRDHGRLPASPCRVVGYADGSAIGDPTHRGRQANASASGVYGVLPALRKRVPHNALVPRRSSASDQGAVGRSQGNQPVRQPQYRPRSQSKALTVDPWLINPTRGNCSDYAVSKRHELIKRGLPARTLLLSEVETSSDEHHLVLVVRTKLGDLVMDNLTPQIIPWSRAPYLWIRIQLPNTQYWDIVASSRV
jgi:hypothetical protein